MDTTEYATFRYDTVEMESRLNGYYWYIDSYNS